MNERDIEVELTGPTKIYGIREPAGKKVFVSTTLALQLAASGVINPELAQQLSEAFDASGTSLESDFQKAVEDEAAVRIELLKQLNDLAVGKLKDELATAIEDIQEKNGLLASANIRIAHLESQLDRINAETNEALEKLQLADEKLTTGVAAAEKARVDLEGQLAAMTTRAEAAEKLLAETPTAKPSAKKA